MTIIQIVKRFKFSIILVLSFVVLENVAWIVEPTFFGKLLDALIDKFSEEVIKSDASGAITYGNLINNSTYRIIKEGKTGRDYKKVIRSGHKDKRPFINVMNDEGDILVTYYVPEGAFISVDNGEKVEAGDLLVTIPKGISKTMDDGEANYMLPLILWIFIYLLNVLGGTLHRLYSGKVYAKMYADIATTVIVYSKKKKHPVSQMFARAELAKEYIVFLKERLPEVTWQLSATFGAIIALFFYDWRIAAVALIVIIPIAVINNIYRKIVVKLQKNIHDTREDQYKVFEEKHVAGIQAYYYSMIKPQARIAKWSSVDYTIIKVLLMVIFIVVLFIAIDVDNFSTGNIYAIVSYIWTFIASTDYIPGLMESLTSVRELSTRLAEEEA